MRHRAEKPVICAHLQYMNIWVMADVECKWANQAANPEIACAVQLDRPMQMCIPRRAAEAALHCRLLLQLVACNMISTCTKMSAHIEDEDVDPAAS